MPDMNKENKKSGAVAKTAADIAKCALFVVVMVVSAFIRIPIPYIPLTFQTVAAVLAGLLLGPKWGTVAVAVYVFMGLLGLPVFAGGAGGFGYVFQLSFGYLIGFIAAAFVAGMVAGENTPTFRRIVLAALAAVAANYVFGILYFMLMWIFYYQNAGAWNALLLYNLIYLPKDIVLCFLAALLAKRVYPMIRKLRRKADGEAQDQNLNISENSSEKDYGMFDKKRKL